MRTIHEMALDVSLPGSPAVRCFHQGDVNSREIRVKLFDNGNPVTLNGAMTAEFDAVTNGEIVAEKQPATIDTQTNTVSLLLDAVSLSVAGTMQIDLRVTEGGEILTAQTFSVVVSRAVITPDAVPAPPIRDAIVAVLETLVGEAVDRDTVIAAVNDYLEHHPQDLTAAELKANKFNAFTPTVPNISALTPEQQAAFYPTLHLLYNRFHDANTVDALLDSFSIVNGVLCYTDADGDVQEIGRVSVGYSKAETDILLAAKANSADVPTKTSDLTNDSGYLSAHQDISGKANAADVYTKAQSDAKYLQAHQDISGKADKATTLAGYGITDAYTKTQVDGMIPVVPVNVSAFANDAGYLTAHQDISGKANAADAEMKANKINTFSADGPTDYDDLTPAQQRTYYPTLRFLYNYFYDHTETDDLLAAKANVSAVYSKAETDAAIQTAIGNVENGAY